MYETWKDQSKFVLLINDDEMYRIASNFNSYEQKWGINIFNDNYFSNSYNGIESENSSFRVPLLSFTSRILALTLHTKDWA